MISLNKMHLSIGVLTGATLVVVALALAAYVMLFPPQYRGWGEVTGGGTGIAGWMINERAREERVRVQLYVGEQFMGEQFAELPRPDVVAAGFTKDARCGYSFPLPRLAPGAHVARIYAVHEVGDGRVRTLQFTGEPLELRIKDEGGRMK